MKLGAKRAKLVQKFVPRCRGRIFRNERTRIILLNPKLMFWCISYYFGAFGTVWFPYETRCKTGRTSAKVRDTKSSHYFSQRTHLVQKFVPQSRVGIFRSILSRSTPLDPKLMFWFVSYDLGAFGTVWLPYKTRCKTGRTSAKVRPTKSCRNVCKERTRSTPLDPKLTF